MKILKTLLQSNKVLIFLALLCCILGLFRVFLFNKSHYDINTKELFGKVIDYKIDGDYLKLTLKAKEKIVVKYYFSNEKQKSRYQEKIVLGMKLKVKGTMQIPPKNTIPNTFNYNNYLKQNRIFFIMEASDINIIESKIPFYYKIKNYIIKKINSIKDNSSYYHSFILGNKDYLDDKVYDNYKKCGITHLFAISGMHISLFIFVLSALFKKIHMHKVGDILLIIFLLFYIFLTDFSASCIRAVIFYFFMRLNKYMSLNTIRLLLYTIIFILFINPFFIFDIGFLYSVTATITIILCSKRFAKKNYFLKTLFISFYICLTSLPITLYNFYEINPLSIIFNILFIPFVSFIIYPLILLSFIFSFLSPITNIFIYLIEICSFCLSKCSINIVFAKMPIIFIIIYYLSVFLIIVKKKAKLWFAVAIILCILKLQPFINPHDYVYALDVGQGDSFILKYEYSNKIVMIDTGGKLNYFKEQWRTKSNEYHNIDNIILFIKSLGISHIDTLILTHGDYDHMGDAINLVENFKVEKVIFNCGDYNDLENELIKILEKKKTPYYSCIKELNVDKNKLYFLQAKEYNNENDNSNVFYTELNNYKFMFMGDASTLTEKEILEKYNLPNIDVLKVGHHGSNTSSSKEFIDEINPKYSIISVGKNNRYGHPNKEVLENLNHSKIYRTDIDGTIMFKVKNNKLKIKMFIPWKGEA